MNYECTVMLKESCKMMKLTDAWVKIIMKVSDITLEISWLLLQLTITSVSRLIRLNKAEALINSQCTLASTLRNN